MPPVFGVWPVLKTPKTTPKPCKKELAWASGRVFRSVIGHEWKIKSQKKRPNFKKIRPFFAGFFAKKNPVSLIK